MDWEVLIWNGQFATIKRLKHYEGIKRTQKEKIDSLNTKVADMKKNLNQKTNSEIDKIIGKNKRNGYKRGWSNFQWGWRKSKCSISINCTRGYGKIAELKSKIYASFDNAVKHVVSTVLKA